MADQRKSRIRGRGERLAEAGALAALAEDPAGLEVFLTGLLDRVRGQLSADAAVLVEPLGDDARAVGVPLDPARAASGLAAEPVDAGPLLEQARRLGDGAEPGSVEPGSLELDGRAWLVAPLLAGARGLGLVGFARAASRPFGGGEQARAATCAELASAALVTARQAARLGAERARLRERNRLLEGEVSGPGHAGARLDGFPSTAARELASAARRVAVTEAPVLITGETGTGKEVLARAIHGWSRRANGPFVKLNCAALPEGLVESELFGHRRGAFSGATTNRPGRFSVASGGTLLLDEIGDLPAGAQAKLLRVLQEGAFEPVGSDETVHVDVRILAATHVDLERAIEQGRFREDLYYRLNVLPLRVPPLRERVEDLSRLSREILADIVRRTGRGPRQLAPAVLERLAAYPWPGNVRELVNVLERAVALAQDGELEVSLPDVRARLSGQAGRRRAGAAEFETLEQLERNHLQRVLEATGGKVYGPGGAAEVLGLKPSTLQSRMKKLGVPRRADRAS